MANTKPHVGYVELEKVHVWCDPKDGQIHITSDDPDPLIKQQFHTTINNNPRSKRYHPTGYRQLATILTRYGKTVPGWTENGPAEEPTETA